MIRTDMVLLPRWAGFGETTKRGSNSKSLVNAEFEEPCFECDVNYNCIGSFIFSRHFSLNSCMQVYPETVACNFK